MDTPVHSHSLQAEAQFSEGRGCSSDTGAHPLSTCGRQGEKAAAAHDFIVLLTRALAPELRSHKGADREASRSSCAIYDLRV